jgi:membrane protein DedA with SNARE-associated domain
MQSIVEWLVQFATDVVSAWGLPGVFVLMTLESACIPVPSEAIMLFAGFAVSEGDMSFWGAVVAGVAGNVVGSWIAYGIGLYGGRPFIDRWGKYVLLRHHHLDLAERWFDRWGAPTVFFSRMLPIVRTFISLPAGMGRMPFWKFTTYTLLGCIPWVIFLTWLGVEAGDNWEAIEKQLKYLDYVVAVAIVGVVVWLVVRRLRGGAGPDGAENGGASAPDTGAEEA